MLAFGLGDAFISKRVMMVARGDKLWASLLTTQRRLRVLK
jgi:hypothetical protein